MIKSSLLSEKCKTEMPVSVKAFIFQNNPAYINIDQISGIFCTTFYSEIS